MAEDHGPFDGRRDVEERLCVVGFQDQGQGGIVEAEIPEFLLGIQQAGSGLVHRDPGRDQRFATQNLFVS